jgi:hypothetical protein
MEVDAEPSSSGAPASNWNYAATASKPSAVIKAVVGHFTSAGDTNLIIA